MSLMLSAIGLITEAQDCAKCHGAIMIETSAKSAVNVASLFIEIGKSVCLSVCALCCLDYTNFDINISALYS